jgi:hypothetical protein
MTDVAHVMGKLEGALAQLQAVWGKFLAPERQAADK